MASSSNKKLSILYVFEVLKEHSDENHFLTHQQIISKIENIYDMKCERKSIGANIDALIDFGVDIVKDSRKGCYLVDRNLEPSEVSFIVDAIFSSKSINGKQAKDLANKLSNGLSKYQKKKFNYIYKADNVTRTDSYEIFLNIEIIQEAIEKGKKIQFKYNRPYFEKSNDSKMYTINPYFLINSQGRYYLVCNYDYFNELANYKVDLISDVKILDDDVKPITKLKDCEKGVDIAKYVNEHIYAFGKNTIKATLKLSGEHAVSYVVDWFGNDISFYKKDDNSIYVDIEVNEQALIYWCLQYGENIELVSPVATRNKIVNSLEKILKKYKGE